MNDQELLTLVAKDYVVKTYRFAIQHWTRQRWHEEVQTIRDTFTDETLKNARIAYPDA